MRLTIAALSGVLFALGLAVSGMTQPGKVQGFLDVFGDWDPSLAFVMGGAIVVNFLFFRFVLRMENPLTSAAFDIPTNRKIDARLIGGSALFGLGWGFAGYCPGPVLTSLGTFDGRVLLFILAMVGGMLIHRQFVLPKR